MGPAAAALIPAGASVIGGLISAFGQGQTNAANAREAQRTRDFQERMRATQYQTAVDDMRKAGLNPALAYQQGGSGTPTGATATMQNPAADAASSAHSAASLLAQYQQMRKTAAEINNVQDTNAGIRLQNQILQYKWMSDVLGYEVTRETLPAVIRRIKAETDASVSGAKEAESSARIRQLEIPEAEAIASFYRSIFGKASPYLNSGAAVLRGLRLPQLRGRSLQH